MFSKELEEVIDAAIADGVLTDKERAVLHKRAQAEGVDPDELDVVIDGRLAKKKKEEDWLRPAPPKAAESTKVGNVMKCPNCGAPYQPGTGKCPECGHYFQNVAAVSSAQRMAEGIQKILNGPSGILGFGELTKQNKISRYIADFPVPNSKDDMLEFITARDVKRKSKSLYDGDFADKYKEVVKKAQLLFPDDPQIQKAIAITNHFSIRNVTRKQWGFLLIIILIIGYIYLMWLLFSSIFSH